MCRSEEKKVLMCIRKKPVGEKFLAADVATELKMSTRTVSAHLKGMEGVISNPEPGYNGRMRWERV